MGNLLCQNTNKRKRTTVRNVSAFEAGNEVSSSVVVEMSSRRLSSEDTGSRKLDKDSEEEMKSDEESYVLISHTFCSRGTYSLTLLR